MLRWKYHGHPLELKNIYAPSDEVVYPQNELFFTVVRGLHSFKKIRGPHKR